MKKIDCICESCQKPFQTRPAEINRGGGRFCSLSCSGRRKRTPEKLPNCQCAHCNKEIWIKETKLGKGKTGLHFCSRECMDTHEWRREPSHTTCLGCGVHLRKKSATAKYCSRNCRLQHIYNSFIEEWLVGKRSGSHGEGISHFIRRWLFKKHDRKCQICGWSQTHPTTGRIPLTVNHIDGNWSNNRPENLELICPNCHALTPNFGALNKGKGRPQRLARLKARNGGGLEN